VALWSLRPRSNALAGDGFRPCRSGVSLAAGIVTTEVYHIKRLRSSYLENLGFAAPWRKPCYAFAMPLIARELTWHAMNSPDHSMGVLASSWHPLPLATRGQRLISIEDTGAKPIGLGTGRDIFYF
jgi:hypothetical protein